MCDIDLIVPAAILGPLHTVQGDLRAAHWCQLHVETRMRAVAARSVAVLGCSRGACIKIGLPADAAAAALRAQESWGSRWRAAAAVQAVGGQAAMQALLQPKHFAELARFMALAKRRRFAVDARRLVRLLLSGAVESAGDDLLTQFT